MKTNRLCLYPRTKHRFRTNGDITISQPAKPLLWSPVLPIRARQTCLYCPRMSAVRFLTLLPMEFSVSEWQVVEGKAGRTMTRQRAVHTTISWHGRVHLPSSPLLPQHYIYHPLLGLWTASAQHKIPGELLRHGKKAGVYRHLPNRSFPTGCDLQSKNICWMDFFPCPPSNNENN